MNNIKIVIIRPRLFLLNEIHHLLNSIFLKCESYFIWRNNQFPSDSIFVLISLGHSRSVNNSCRDSVDILLPKDPFKIKGKHEY